MQNNQQVFLELVKAGLWEKDSRISQFGKIDFEEVYRLAEEQAVVGLVAAGLEHVVDVKPLQDILLLFIGTALQLEQQDKEMNAFLAELVEQMREKEIYALLVKGQGIAQCYERPLWRASGDIDLFLSKSNYKKAEIHLKSKGYEYDEIDYYRKHILFTIGTWAVELHGTLRSNLWSRVDDIIDKVQDEVFYHGSVRSWINNGTQIFIPHIDEDIIFVFTHVLQHYFKEGVGLRQICDWCRLLWTYRESLSHELLESRIKKMGLMSEWKAFGALAVNYLGMPSEAMPFYSPEKKWKRKAGKILDFVFESGNFGHNMDTSFMHTDPLYVRKMKTFRMLTRTNIKLFPVFPIDSLRVWRFMFVSRLSLTISKLMSRNGNR